MKFVALSRFLTMFVLCCAVWPRTTPAQTPPRPHDDPLADARQVPASVVAYVSFAGLGTALDQTIPDSARDALQALYRRTRTRESWDAFAQLAATDPPVLFDELLSRRFTLVRAAPPPEEDEPGFGPPGWNDAFDEGFWDPEHWLLITAIEPGSAERLVASFEARPFESIGQTRVLITPDESTYLARQDDRLFLAGSNALPLLREALRLATPGKDGKAAASLAADPDFREAAALKPTLGFKFLRGHRDRRPWEATSLEITRDGLTVRNRRRFARAAMPEDRVDQGLFQALKDQAAFVRLSRVRRVRQPDFGPGMLPSDALVMFRPDLGARLGPTSIFVTDLADYPVAGDDGVVATMFSFGWAVRLDEAATIKAMDGYALRFLDGMSMMGGEHFEVRKPDALPDDPTRPRRGHIEVLEPMPGPMPAPAGFDVVWSAAQRGGEWWWIAATHEGLHGRMIEAVRKAPVDPAEPPLLVRATLRAPAAGAMLRTWPGVTAEADDPALSRMWGFAGVFNAVQTVSWTTEALDEHTTETVIEAPWAMGE